MRTETIFGAVFLAVCCFFLCSFKPLSPAEFRKKYAIPEPRPAVQIVKPRERTVDEHIDEVSSLIKQKGFTKWLLRGLIHVESGGNPKARRFEKKLNTSSRGMTQVLETTAAIFGVKGHELEDPETAIYVGAFYLRDCLKHERGDQLFALACYNAGPKKSISQYPKKSIRYAQNVIAVSKRIQRGEKL